MSIKTDFNRGYTAGYAQRGLDERKANGPSDGTPCSGRVLQPDEPIEIGDKMLLVGGSWITVDTPGFLAKDFIEIRRPNSKAD